MHHPDPLSETYRQAFSVSTANDSIGRRGGRAGQLFIAVAIFLYLDTAPLQQRQRCLNNGFMCNEYSDLVRVRMFMSRKISCDLALFRHNVTIRDK